ncbi:MAG: citrulline utilization hydrolase CtlX [Woeseiaceae bacterium]
MMTEQESQLAERVLMIRPVCFRSNPLTAQSNRFQGKSGLTAQAQQVAALREFDDLANMLRQAGIDVIVVEDTPSPETPDSIFPNNWISLHGDGRIVLYPMEAENRRTERRMDIVDYLSNEQGLFVTEIVDLSQHEEAGHYLEGTGSMVLDRSNRIAYACLSSRTHLDPLGDFAQRMNYSVVAFDAVDREGVPIYHTNVLMNVGEKIAVICDEAIQNAEQRSAVLRQLHDTDHDVISLNFAQLEAFAGNMLELRNSGGERVVAMSNRAFDALDGQQREKLEANGGVVHACIDEIENSAGGSVRCMLAEVHLPKVTS